MKILLGTLLLIALPASSIAADGNDTTVERWNGEFLAAVRRQAPPPCVVARNLAILHLAIWKALEGTKGHDATAIAVAAHEVNTAMFCGDRAGFDRLMGEYAHGDPETIRIAREAAALTMKQNEDDGCNTSVHYHPDLAAGVWERTTNNRAPELPHWGLVKPFVLTSAGEFRPPPPPALGSEAYAMDVNEVRELGSAASKTRTEEQSLIAKFWSDFSYTTSPVGRWNEIAGDAMKARDFTAREKAHVFMILNLSMADAGIAIWECKYHYKFWRPVSAARETFDDENAATIPDKEWNSMLPSPSHPDYVSGHSTFSGAASWVLTKALGAPSGPVIVTNRDMPGVTRTFPDYEAIAREAGRSRIYGGIHFTSANEQGSILGKKIAAKVWDKYAVR